MKNEANEDPADESLFIPAFMFGMTQFQFMEAKIYAEQEYFEKAMNAAMRVNKLPARIETVLTLIQTTFEHCISNP